MSSLSWARDHTDEPLNARQNKPRVCSEWRSVGVGVSAVGFHEMTSALEQPDIISSGFTNKTGDQSTEFDFSPGFTLTTPLMDL